MEQRGQIENESHHQISDHVPVWAYAPPRAHKPFFNSDKKIYDILPPDSNPKQVLAVTPLVVLLGAEASSEALELIQNQQCILLIFEPDEIVLEQFLEMIPPARLSRRGIFCFTGGPTTFTPPLQDLLPKEIIQAGFPAFFCSQRISQEYGLWANKITEYLEILYYRQTIYSILGQALVRSLPLRNITRDLFYDQQLHSYENICEYTIRPDISQLRNAFAGEAAILVAAGPALAKKIDFIRENKGRAMVISVNNAIKPLLEAGIKPHFVVINDTSIDSGQVFKHIDKSPETILVGHCLSDLGGDRFHQKFLFGTFQSEIYPPRPMLRLHGSVISTAFSLARHLGCTKCVFVGVQLASDNPWELGYAKGALKPDVSQHKRELIHRHPQLYPVLTPSGETLFTTLNFRDAALWLSEEIRLSGIECINTCPSSILFGEGIIFEENPQLPKCDLKKRFSDLFNIRGLQPDVGKILTFIKMEQKKWRDIASVLEQLNQSTDDDFVPKGLAILEQLDQGNITNLVQRFEDFNNVKFNNLVFSSATKSDKAKGLHYYFHYVIRMTRQFEKVLKEQEGLIGR